ncbi:hypothetical protein ABTG41_19330, partial [Acinetobacter baumannii]
TASAVTLLYYSINHSSDFHHRIPEAMQIMIQFIMLTQASFGFDMNKRPRASGTARDPEPVEQQF